MAVTQNISMLSDLKLKLPKTKEELVKIESILKNPRVLKAVEENPDLKRLIATFVVKLKKEWDNKNKRVRKRRETKDINWLCRYLSSFNCMGLLGENEVHKTKKKVKKEKTVVAPPKQETTNLHPNGVSKKEIIPALAQALLVAKDLKDYSELKNTQIKGIKLHLDGNTLPGCNFLGPSLYQGFAEMLIRNLNQKYQEKSQSQFQKSRVVHNLDLNDCTNRKFISATFSPINTASKIIIIKPLEWNGSPHRNFTKAILCSATQTEECNKTDWCDCYSLDSQLSTMSNPSRYEKVIEVCKRMASPSFHSYDLRRDGTRSKTTEDTCTSDCLHQCTSTESTSECNQDSCSCGPSVFSSVFSHFQSPAMLTSRLPETIAEDCSRGYSCANYSESFESNEMLINDEECYEIQNSFPSHRSIMVGEDTDTCKNIQSDLEGQIPPEISTGFSDLSYKNDECFSYSEEGSDDPFNNDNCDVLDCCSSFFVNENGEIIPSNKEQKCDVDQVEDNYENQITNESETILKNQAEFSSSGDECEPLKVNRYYFSNECPEFGSKNIQRPVRETSSDQQLTQRVYSTSSSRRTLVGNVQGLSSERKRGDEASSEASSLGKETVMELVQEEQHDGGKREERDVVKWEHQEGFVKRIQEAETGRRDETGRTPRQGNPGRRTHRRLQNEISSSSEALIRPPPPWKVRQEAKRHSKHKHKGCIIT